MAAPVLSLGALNRASLARQGLLDRSDRRPLDLLTRLVAMQGQVSNAPYVGLWSRISNFGREELTALIQVRRVVRAPTLRGTLQLQAAEDYHLLQPLLREALSRNLRLFAARTPRFDAARGLAELLEFLRERPRTGVELRAKMEELCPGFGMPSILDSVRMEMGWLQIPPAGVWGFTGRPLYAEASSWLRRSLKPGRDGLRDLLVRYLAAFGPASVQDMQTWSGLPRLGPSFEVARSELEVFRDEDGRELFDLPEAPRPASGVPAPVRFLPEFDNLLFGYQDRRRVLSEAHHPLLLTRDYNCAAVLIDGFAKGRWKAVRRPDRITLRIDLFEPLRGAKRAELEGEAEGLAAWMVGGERNYDIEIRTHRP